VEYLQANGFKVEVRDVGNTAARKHMGVQSNSAPATPPA